MASSLKHIIVFLLISLFATAHARESQFFSKVTKETSSSQQVPGTEQQKQTTTLTNNEQQIKQEEPTFVPQTTGDSYGLYGHETGQFAPGSETMTSTNSNNGTPYRTTVSEESELESESLYGNINNMNYEQNNNNNNNNNYNKYNNNDNGESLYSKTGESLYSNNNNNYEQQQNTYEQYNNNNNYNNENSKYTYNKDSYVTDEERARSVGSYTTTSSNTNSAALSNQEGMSDTRFMEGGKYFYDVNNEQKYYPTYRYENSRSTSTNGEGYNNNRNGIGGYTANNYRNSNSEYNNGNSMDGAYGQNQEEFQEVQEELEP